MGTGREGGRGVSEDVRSCGMSDRWRYINICIWKINEVKYGEVLCAWGDDRGRAVKCWSTDEKWSEIVCVCVCLKGTGRMRGSFIQSCVYPLRSLGERGGTAGPHSTQQIGGYHLPEPRQSPPGCVCVSPPLRLHYGQKINKKCVWALSCLWASHCKMPVTDHSSGRIKKLSEICKAVRHAGRASWA